jgi:hypothetical protein
MGQLHYGNLLPLAGGESSVRDPRNSHVPPYALTGLIACSGRTPDSISSKAIRQNQILESGEFTVPLLRPRISAMSAGVLPRAAQVSVSSFP